MKKKQYIIPSIDICLLSTKELLKTDGTSPGLPPGPGTQAPRRKTEVF